MTNFSRRSLVKGVLAAPLVGAFADNVFAATQRTESSWAALTDDPSRADLFDKEIRPAGLREEAGQPPTAMAIPPIFYFPKDARFDSIENKPRQNSIFGIDISHHNKPNLRFDLLRLQGIRFVYIKATQGTGFKDNMFGTFWQKAGALPEADRVYRGAYHFLSSDKPGRAQADSFLDYLDLHGGLKAGDMVPVIDLEWDVVTGNPDRWSGRGAAYILDVTLSCVKRIKERSGRTPMIYTAKSWFGPKTIPLSQISALKDFPLWIADYNDNRKLSEKPAVPDGMTASLWQFSDRAQLSTGYTGGVDSNIFYGSEADFKQAFGIG
jgi:lysozyme